MRNTNRKQSRTYALNQYGLQEGAKGSTDEGQKRVKVSPVVGTEGMLEGDLSFEGYSER